MSNNISLDSITFTSSYAITDPSEVDKYCHFLIERVEKFEEHCYFISPTGNECKPNNIDYKLIVGPFLFEIAYDPTLGGVEVTGYANIPFVPPVQLMKVQGNLKEGIAAGFGVPGLATGKIGFKLVDGSAVFHWDVDLVPLNKAIGEKIIF